MVGGTGLTTAGCPSPPVTQTRSLSAMMDVGVPNSSEKKSSPKRRGSKSTSSAQKKQQQQQKIATSNSATATTLLSMSSDRRLSASSIGSLTHNIPPPSLQHGFTTTASTADAAHGFGYPANPTAGGISIVAPSHEDVAKTRFPEPSPAACGKRKLAEIAAAQMLAGVIGDTIAKNSNAGHVPENRASVNGTAAIAVAATKAAEDDADSIGEDERASTPPPPEGSVKSMSLQIVNPDNLVGQTSASKRRLIHGQASPSTPWDGQLEALVR